jgi:hypothetical protein
LNSPTLATTAEAVVGPTPSSVDAFFARSSDLTWLAMRWSHQAICTAPARFAVCRRQVSSNVAVADNRWLDNCAP